MRKGFGILASYTLSKTIDVGGEQLIGDVQLRDARNVFLERAASSADMRNRLVISGLWELPFGRGKAFPINNSILNAIAGGWQVNGIATLRSGQPFTPQQRASSANTGNPRPDRIADGNLPSGQRDPALFFDKSAFVEPTPFNFGNAGRNILTGPGAINFDLSVFKKFPLTGLLGEGSEVQYRAEFFNAFNHPQFGSVNPRVDIPQGGTITTLSTPMRQIQMGLKLIF